MTYTPVADASGSAIITVTVNDGGGGTQTIQRTFTVTVSAVNDQPTLSAITDPASIPEDSGLQTVNLAGISAGGGESQTLTVTATSDNTGPDPEPDGELHVTERDWFAHVYAGRPISSGLRW